MNDTFDLFAQSPERLDANVVFQAAGLGFWEFDPATSMITWDDRTGRLFGLTRENQLPYARFIAHIHSDDVDRVHTAIQQALNTHHGEGSFDQTYRTIGERETRSRRIRFMGRSSVDETRQITRLAGVAFNLPDESQPDTQWQRDPHEPFQQLVEQAPAAMALFSGPQLTVTVANKPMLRYWDRTSEQVLNRPLLDALPSAFGQTIYESVRAVLTTGEPAVLSELAVSVPRHEGPEHLYISLSLEPFRDAAGTITGVLAVGHDVTELVTSRQLVEARRIELMAAVDAAEISIWSLNVQTEQFRSNDRMKTLFGIPNTAEASIRFFFDRIVEEDRQRMLDSFMHALQYESGGRCEIQYSILHAVTGQKRTIRSRGQTQFDSEGIAQRFSCIAQDITVRQQAEEALRTSETRFRTLANSIDHLAWIANADGSVAWYNQRWYDYAGTDSRHKKGWGWQYVYHPDHVDRVVAFVTKAWQQGEPFELTAPIRRHDGVYRWFLIRGYPIRDAEGNVQQWIGSNTDIDEQKQVEASLEAQVRDRTAQLQVLVQNLQRSNENLRQFAYIASHDLQEPLRKIQQFGDLLKSEYNDQLGSGTAYLDRMQLAASRMSTLIRDLLSYSRIAIQPDSIQLVSLRQVIDDAIADLSLLADEADSTFRIEPLPTISGDASQLGQLFQNLLSNALKFHRPGVQPVVTITCVTVPADALPDSARSVRVADAYYRIDVSDNGIGFDEKYLDRIFQVFQRLHTRSEYAGTGIGLAICSKVVANHGGAIIARSQPGQGSTFSIYFPRD